VVKGVREEHEPNGEGCCKQYNMEAYKPLPVEQYPGSLETTAGKECY
jgi:hypothetical protein